MTKPFNLEDWKTGNYQVQTKSGRKVLDLHYFKDVKGDFCLAGVLDDIINGISTWTSNGIFNIRFNDDPLDLVLVIPEMWVNVYKLQDNKNHCSPIFNSETEAIEELLMDTEIEYIGTFKLVKDGE